MLGKLLKRLGLQALSKLGCAKDYAWTCAPTAIQQSHQRECAARSAYLDHDKVLVDDAIVGEAAHGGDVLLGHINLCRGQVAVLALLANLVHLLVLLSPVVVTVLARTCHCPRHAGRMPCTNARHLQGSS